MPYFRGAVKCDLREKRLGSLFNQGFLCQGAKSCKFIHLVELIEGLLELCIEQLIQTAGHLCL